MTLHPDIPGERLDAFLARAVENMTRSAAQKLIEDGCVQRTGKPAKKNDKLNPGDEITLTIPEPKRWTSCPPKCLWTSSTRTRICWC